MRKETWELAQAYTVIIVGLVFVATMIALVVLG